MFSFEGWSPFALDNTFFCVLSPGYIQSPEDTGPSLSIAFNSLMLRLLSTFCFETWIAASLPGQVNFSPVFFLPWGFTGDEGFAS